MGNIAHSKTYFSLMKIPNKFLSILFLLFAQFTLVAQVIRGPYLQSVSPSQAIVRWRTEQATESKVVFGDSPNKLNKSVESAQKVTEHELLISNLKPNKKYYYTIGDSKNLEPATEKRFILTAPKLGSTQPVRIWALGDFGSGSKNQLEVKNAIINYTKNHRPDAWIWLGDNAYSKGLDEEYQKKVFPIYQEDFFQNLNLYPAPGNHDYAGKHDPAEPPYFKIFNMPVQGELGGVPSGNESYYSINYGQVHLVSIDSELMEPKGLQVMDGKGAQFEWLEKDLASNKLPWTIVYFHKPPYSKGSHDSDTEKDMVKMRENVNPLFEKYKVDIVMAGHSHVYERTHPLRGHYGINNTFDASKHIVEKTSAPNEYVVGKEGQGVIYIVNGSGGQLGGQREGYPLKSSIYSNNKIGGSMILDITKSKLEAVWLGSDGEIHDRFSITKK